MSHKKISIIFYFLSLVAIGSIGFYILGGDRWTWIDSIYMTIITLSTVGFGEVLPLNQTGKVWAILVIIFGVTGIGILFRNFKDEFIQFEKFRRLKMMKNISKFKNHYIICGYGRMGAVIANELQQKNHNFIVIEKDNDKVEKIRNKGIYCVEGDATSEDTLQAARVDKASGVAVVLDTDQDNLFVTMSMKTKNPELFILSRCSLEDNKAKLIRAGANKVVNPYTAGGHRMAEMLSKPQVEDSISVLSPKHEDLNLELDEISLNDMKQYDGIPLKECNIKEDYDIIVIGIIKDSGETIINPDSNIVLNSSDMILLMGEVENMDKFKSNLPSKPNVV